MLVGGDFLGLCDYAVFDVFALWWSAGGGSSCECSKAGGRRSAKTGGETSKSGSCPYEVGSRACKASKEATTGDAKAPITDDLIGRATFQRGR